jgi:Do/DeqQ family serine protease
MSNSIQFRRSTAILALVAASIGGGLIAAFAVMSHNNTPIAVTARAQTNTTKSSQQVNQLSTSFANVIEKASPAVVEISMTRVVKASEQQQNNPFLSDPFFRQFFGGQQMQPRTQREEGLGSGVIVSPDGYIVTNNHVVSHASSLKVTLSDGREFSGKTVGTDPQTDVAVVKINATNLPVLPFGNSDSARVGDIVFAIGNPFGEEHTVTMGIVSAKNRTLREGGHSASSIQNFIQTDAAINPGNSGGALINAQGQMIAMNTAILTGGNTFGGGEGGNIGIGFAIPSNMAKQVMDQLIKTGKVSRGYIGVMLQDLNGDLANEFHVNTSHGAVVAKVDPGTPGAKAGLQPGDVIVGINGQKVDGMADATLKVTEHAPGSTIVLDVIRNGSPMKVNVTLGTRPTAANFGEPNANQNGNEEQQNNGQGGNTSVDGITVETLTPDLAQQVNVPANTKGVVVDSVDQAAPAADRIGRGMVITQVNRHPVNNVQEFDRLMNESKGKPVMLTVMADNVPQFVVIQPYNK